MSKTVKTIMIAAGLFILVSASCGIGIVMGSYGRPFIPIMAQAKDQPAEFQVFWQVWGLAQTHFVDRAALDNTKMSYGAVNGLLKSLGDEGHTRFLTPEETNRQKTHISGKFFGIGARVGVEEGMTVIVTPMDDSPAYRAGVKAGDIIMAVDGEDVTSFPLNEVVDRIRGEEGTEVQLTLFRPETNKSLEVTIVRAEIKIPAASWAMVPGTDVAIIRLTQFNANITTNLIKSINEAKDAGAVSLIVDVRNNPGGLLDQAIKVGSQFLSSGDVLLQEDANGKRTAFPVEKGGVATDVPIVVLINRGSASAAEIFAGAIQDHKRGDVVGETSFGTGTVLRPFNLDDGSTLLLGTSQWLTPNGRLIRKQGIEPDVVVDISITAKLPSISELKDMTTTELLATEDEQLLKALELLNALPQGASK